MTLERRLELIARIASVINEPLDIPGISEEFEQTALQFALTQIHALLPEKVGDVVLELLASLPPDSLLSFLKFVLPTWLRFTDNPDVEKLGTMISFLNSPYPSSGSTPNNFVTSTFGDGAGKSKDVNTQIQTESEWPASWSPELDSPYGLASTARPQGDAASEASNKPVQMFFDFEDSSSQQTDKPSDTPTQQTTTEKTGKWIAALEVGDQVFGALKTTRDNGYWFDCYPTFRDARRTSSPYFVGWIPDSQIKELEAKGYKRHRSFPLNDVITLRLVSPPTDTQYGRVVPVDAPFLGCEMQQDNKSDT